MNIDGAEENFRGNLWFTKNIVDQKGMEGSDKRNKKAPASLSLLPRWLVI